MQPIQSAVNYSSAASAGIGAPAFARGTAPAIESEQAMSASLVKAGYLSDTAGSADSSAPELAPPVVDADSAAAAQTVVALRDQGLESTQKAGALVDQMLAQSPPVAPPNYLYGLSDTLTNRMQGFEELMGIMLKLMQASVQQKAKSLEMFQQATNAQAQHQEGAGRAAMMGSIAAAATGIAFAGAGTIKTTAGLKKEFVDVPGAQRARTAHLAGNAGVAEANVPANMQQATIDTSTHNAKSAQAMGDLMSRNMAPQLSQLANGISESQQATHQKQGTEDGASSTILNNISDQQGQDANNSAALVKRLLEQMEQACSSQRAALSSIANSIRT